MITPHKQTHDSDSFIKGWYIPKEICYNLIQYYEKRFDRTEAGLCGGDDGVPIVKKDVKDSQDLYIDISNDDPQIKDYMIYLQKCCDEYKTMYPECNLTSLWTLEHSYNIQKYNPGQGFKIWHSERTPSTNLYRHLVWMTYLNTVPNAGTEFKLQKLKTEAECGLTLIWPVDWTYTHKGVVSNTHTKYIITGWYVGEGYYGSTNPN